ncbi:MAG TPA: phosphoribosylglycinamide formyltransferase [Gemmatimonadaceae bacterium]|nr:phosphoribosylglycinamide formyltransferase [Gemmatimonadaceae bacterium]
MPRRIAVLASGRGSNLRVMLEYFAHSARREAATVVLVASNKPDAGALGIARDAGIEARVLDTGPEHEAALLHLFDEQEIDIVVLGGYLRLIPGAVVRRYSGRMINVHPALLPAFGGPGMYGARVHRAVLTAGVRLSGPTVHFVDDIYDHGAIIAQWPVPVFPGDTEEAVASRVLYAEHRLLPRVVHALAIDRIRLMPDGRVEGATLRGDHTAFFALDNQATLEVAMEKTLGLD